MKTSIALIALTLATLSGAASAATSQSSLFDKSAATSPSTIWSTGELGFVQNPHGAVKAMVDAPSPFVPHEQNWVAVFSANGSLSTVKSDLQSYLPRCIKRPE